jgi:hypothetical protein
MTGAQPRDPGLREGRRSAVSRPGEIPPSGGNPHVRSILGATEGRGRPVSYGAPGRVPDGTGFGMKLKRMLIR